jgi:hypothetical protein
VVVFDGVAFARRRFDGRRLFGVINRNDSSLDNVGLLQVATQRNDDVTCFDESACDLWQERVVRHVRKWVNQRYLGFASTQVLLQLKRGVKTGVSATDYKNFGHDNYS